MLGSGSQIQSFPRSLESDVIKNSLDSATHAQEVKIEATHDTLLDFNYTQERKQNLLFIPKVTDKKNGNWHPNWVHFNLLSPQKDQLLRQKYHF